MLLERRRQHSPRVPLGVFSVATVVLSCRVADRLYRYSRTRELWVLRLERRLVSIFGHCYFVLRSYHSFVSFVRIVRSSCLVRRRVGHEGSYIVGTTAFFEASAGMFKIRLPDA
jgi:hypothetical protein